MREAPGTSGLKLNLLRWLVCSVVVLNLNVQAVAYNVACYWKLLWKYFERENFLQWNLFL